MKEENKKEASAICRNCGQKMGFYIENPYRKTQHVKCPVCKKMNFVMTDRLDNCLFRLMEYEQSGMSPIQIAALLAIYEDCKKYPELKGEIEEWEKVMHGICEAKEMNGTNITRR
jgi:hypothetical protein